MYRFRHVINNHHNVQFDKLVAICMKTIKKKIIIEKFQVDRLRFVSFVKLHTNINETMLVFCLKNFCLIESEMVCSSICNGKRFL